MRRDAPRLGRLGRAPVVAIDDPRRRLLAPARPVVEAEVRGEGGAGAGVVQQALEREPGELPGRRSGPDLARVKARAPNPTWRRGRRFLVGYVGVMGQQEGIDLLLEAAAHAVHKLGRQDVQFCLVGGGPSLEELKTQAEALDLGDRVTFTGRVADETLFEVLSTADVCVNPDEVNALNDLSTMNKILEYMALSKPIVQFDVKEGRFSAQSASLYAARNDPQDFARKILELLDDPERRQEMGAFARRRIEQSLSWDHEKPKLVACYHRLFGQQPVQNAPVGDAGLGDRVH